MSEERATIESAVAKIWREVLAVECVNAKDNFLDMGGNSLRAGEIVWRIRDELGIDVPVDIVLDRETFNDLVDVITTSPQMPAAQ